MYTSVHECMENVVTNCGCNKVFQLIKMSELNSRLFPLGYSIFLCRRMKRPVHSLNCDTIDHKPCLQAPEHALMLKNLNKITKN